MGNDAIRKVPNRRTFLTFCVGSTLLSQASAGAVADASPKQTPTTQATPVAVDLRLLRSHGVNPEELGQVLTVQGRGRITKEQWGIISRTVSKTT